MEAYSHQYRLNKQRTVGLTVVVGELQVVEMWREEVLKGLVSARSGGQLHCTVLLTVQYPHVVVWHTRTQLLTYSQLVYEYFLHRHQRTSCLTCHGLEQVSTVLHVVVTVVVVGALTQRSALLIGSEVPVHGRFEVIGRQPEWLVAVVALPQQEVGLRRGGCLTLLVVWGHIKVSFSR